MSHNCGRCGKVVFDAEEVKSHGRVYHNVCFKCKACAGDLQPIDTVDNAGEIYCRKCYGKNFGPTGFRGGVTPAGEVTDDGAKPGLDSDLKLKQDSKYDPKLEAQAREFIESKTGETLGENFQEALKDGMVLCNLANKLKAGAVTGHKASTMAFSQMENISRFLTALRVVWGFKPTDLFMTVDLFEGKNMGMVVDTILMLKRKVSYTS